MFLIFVTISIKYLLVLNFEKKEEEKLQILRSGGKDEIKKRKRTTEV